LQRRGTWQLTVPRCALKDRPMISPAVSLEARYYMRNEQD
jgi:hypothetical protein